MNHSLNTIETSNIKKHLIRENARQKVEQFDWDVMKHQWFKIFDDVEKVNI